MKRLISLAIIVAVILGATAAVAVPWQHVRSWTDFVEEGLIEGDPAYYYNELATQGEVNHALVTAILQINSEQWVPPIPGATLDDPASYCAEKMWEYRSTPGAGYYIQAFADTYYYDSITLFDDVYGPVTILNPRMDRLYQHPAGGYDKLVVCMARRP